MTDNRPSRREIAAAATRREIVATARRLFATRGYAATSMQDIADEAGVAVQTIYSSVGAKPALLIALNDLIDEESGIAELAPRIFQTSDPHEMLAGGVHLTRQLNERCGDVIRALLTAEPSDPEAAEAVANGMARHEQGVSAIVGRLAKSGALRDGLTFERARGTMLMMTSAASYRNLTESAGWSFDECERWLTESLSELLLDPRG